MQHEALANTEDFGGPDPVTGPARAALPGKDAPYAHYQLGAPYDEMFAPDGRPRPPYIALDSRLTTLPLEELVRRQQACEQSFLHQGITFTVYSDNRRPSGSSRPIFCRASSRRRNGSGIERGLTQRIQALNLFLRDIYSDGRVLKDGVVPRAMIYGSKHYRREMRGLAGAARRLCQCLRHRSDAQRGRRLRGAGRQSARAVRRLLHAGQPRRGAPRLSRRVPHAWACGRSSIIRWNCWRRLRSLAPFHEDVSIVVLTPGVFNSAYFEHAFLARQMGVELVEGRDLVVNDNVVYTRTTSGLKRIDVIYRRIDDDFIDPLIFREDSSLGVPGLFNAYRAGNVVIANAPGTGVADDKAVYAYVPRLIRYYLSEEPILDNVETFLCREEKSLAHVLANLDKLVVKAVGESGGYGMLVGPHASQAEREAFAEKLKADPENYIAQPTIQLSTAPSFVDGGVEAAPCRPAPLHPARRRRPRSCPAR